MTKKEYDQFTKNLVGKGYKLCNGNHPYYYKTLLKRKDKYDEQRSVCTLIINVYDFSEFVNHECLSYEPVVTISREVEERIDMNLCHPKHSIEECERIALEFMKFVDNQITLKI